MSSMETPDDPGEPEPSEEDVIAAGLIFLGNVLLLMIVATCLPGAMIGG
jgi:hypothetical protein